MEKLRQIDDKIIRLRKLKTNIETRLARELYKKLEAILGEDFTPPLALAIVSETWKSATPKQKENWQSQADRFRSSEESKRSSKNPEKFKSNPEQKSSSHV